MQNLNSFSLDKQLCLNGFLSMLQYAPLMTWRPPQNWTTENEHCAWSQIRNFPSAPPVTIRFGNLPMIMIATTRCSSTWTLRGQGTNSVCICFCYFFASIRSQAHFWISYKWFTEPASESFNSLQDQIHSGSCFYKTDLYPFASSSAKPTVTRPTKKLISRYQ